ncbi:MAG: hypothetical protein RL240_4444, partial [Planctomycetota bacterium]
KYGLTPTPVEISYGDAKGVMDFDTSYIDSYIKERDTK